MKRRRTQFRKAENKCVPISASIRILSSKPLGEEKVAGQSAMKYRAVFQTREGGKLEGFYWQNKAGVHLKQRFPVTDRSGRTRPIETELRDLRIGAQDPALFEVPEGYRRIEGDTGEILGELFGF